jgi:hypothetical protein
VENLIRMSLISVTSVDETSVVEQAKKWPDRCCRFCQMMTRM